MEGLICVDGYCSQKILRHLGARAQRQSFGTTKNYPSTFFSLIFEIQSSPPRENLGLHGNPKGQHQPFKNNNARMLEHVVRLEYSTRAGTANPGFVMTRLPKST